MNTRLHWPLALTIFCIGFAPRMSVIAQPQFEEPVCFDGHSVVSIDIRSKEELELLYALNLDVWECIPGLGPTDVRVSPDQAEVLRELGFDFKTRIPDVQALIDRERSYAPRDAAWFADYHDLNGVFSFMADVEISHSGLVSVSDIGLSLEGRPLRMMTITGAAAAQRKPAVLFHGGQHCREWITVPVACYIAEHLVTNYGTDPVVTALLDRMEWHILPVMNPDGYEYTWNTYRLWRKNRRNNGDGSWGVDLNRNWAFGWGGGGSSSWPNDETYRGPSPFSEPETQVVSNFISANSEIEAYMDYHSYSELILWPWGYTSALPPDNDAFTFVGSTMQQEIADVHGHVYTAGPIYTTIYQASGGSVDWAYGDQGAWGFTIELRDTGENGFILPADQIIPTCEENLPAAMFLAEWATSPVRFEFLNGVPSVIAPQTTTVVNVNVTAGVQSVVPGSPALYYRDSQSESFTQVPLTPLGGDAYEVTLPAFSCAATPQFYFSAQGDLGDMATSPTGAPAAYHSATVATQGVFYQTDFESDPGWSAQGLWARGTPTGGGGDHGGPDPSSAYSGNAVYGYNLSGDYQDNMSETHLTSAAIDCTGQIGVRLSFQRWLGVEQPQYDHAYVRVSNDNSNWTTLWANPSEVADSAWVAQEFDISAVADDQPTVYLRWTMGETDTSWRYCGWNIDDVQLTSLTCAFTPTLGDMDGDGDVDLTDFLTFAGCFGGAANTPPPGGCDAADFDGDNNVDLTDLLAFAANFTG